MSSESTIDYIKNRLATWYPRGIISQTNWLYRVGALRSCEQREMSRLWELAELFQCYTM